MSHRFKPGDAVTLSDTFCPACWSNTGPLRGTIVAHATEADGAMLRQKDALHGPYYRIDIDHEHKGNGAAIYAECELTDNLIQLSGGAR
jgi:hypothetical protein